jgi:hypothetical protein
MAKVKKPSKSRKGYWITGCGEDVTPAVEERWAAEIEAGFRLVLWKRVRVGRPAEGERLWERIGFRLSPEVYDAAAAKAAKELRSIRNLAHEAMKRYVES